MEKRTDKKHPTQTPMVLVLVLAAAHQGRCAFTVGPPPGGIPRNSNCNDNNSNDSSSSSSYCYYYRGRTRGNR